VNKKITITSLAIIFIVLSLSFTSAHYLYYDQHQHFDTKSLDEYFYDYDNAYKYQKNNYNPTRIYYSEYSNRNYYKDYSNYNYYRSYNYPIFTGPQRRSYGHGDQYVQFRLNNYYYDHHNTPYYNDIYNYDNRYNSAPTYLQYDKKIDKGISYYK
jgi:hypothetical protein